MPLMAYVSHINRRTLMLALIVTFCLAHAVTVYSPNFEWLIVSRILVAIAHTVYWAISIPLGIRLAPPGKRAQAMSLVSTGAVLGSLLGIPIGTYLGQILGWRFAFGVIGLFAALVGAVLYVCLPKNATGIQGNFKTIGMLFKRKTLVIVYLVTVIAMSGHYAAFTFITPFLHQLGGISGDRIATVLLMYGVAGLIGGWLSPYFLGVRFQKSALVSVVIVAACLFALKFVAISYAGVMALVFVWGTAFLLFNLILQNLVLAIAPDAEDVAMAGYSGIYNVGIGTGALIGSLSAAHHLASIGFIGAGCIAVSFVLYSALLSRLAPPANLASGH